MLFLRRVPAVLSALVLAAHFFRAGSAALAAASVLLVPLAFIRTPAVTVAARLILVAACAVWLETAWALARVRMAEGRPYLRMVAILSAVAAFAALSAWLLPGSRRRE